MTPKEKASDLLSNFYLKASANNTISISTARECTLIAVDELIKETQFEFPNIRQRFWEEVKQEIEKL